MYSKQYFFNNNKKKFKVVNLKLDASPHLLGNSEMIHIYNGLKNYYTFKNNKSVLKFDSKVGLYMLNRYNSKPAYTAFIYSSFFFPKNSIVKRCIYSFFYKKLSLRMTSFLRLTRRFNRFLVVGLIKRINILNLKSKFLLNNYIVTRKGNYHSGFVLSSFGLSGFFLRFKSGWFRPFIFIIKRVFFNAKFFKLEQSCLRLFKNSFNRLYLYCEYISKLRSKLSLLVIFKFIFREFKNLKFFFRFYLVYRKRVVFSFKNKYRFKIISKLLKIIYPIYKRFIVKNYRKIFSLFISFFRIPIFLVNNFFVYIISCVSSISNQNFFFNSRISMGLLRSFFTLHLKRNIMFKGRKKLLKKAFKFYKYFLNSYKHISNISVLNIYSSLVSSDKLNFINKYFFYIKKIFSVYNYKRLFHNNYLIKHKSFNFFKMDSNNPSNFLKEHFKIKKNRNINRLKNYDNFYKRLKRIKKIRAKKRTYLLKLFNRVNRISFIKLRKYLISKRRRSLLKFKGKFQSIINDKNKKKNKSNKKSKCRLKFRLKLKIKSRIRLNKKRMKRSQFEFRKKGKLTIFRNFFLKFRYYSYKKLKKKFKIHRFNLHHLKSVDMNFLYNRVSSGDLYYNSHDSILLNKLVERYISLFPSGKIFLRYESITIDEILDYFLKFESFSYFDEVGYFSKELSYLISDHLEFINDD